MNDSYIVVEFPNMTYGEYKEKYGNSVLEMFGQEFPYVGVKGKIEGGSTKCLAIADIELEDELVKAGLYQDNVMANSIDDDFDYYAKDDEMMYGIIEEICDMSVIKKGE